MTKNPTVEMQINEVVRQYVAQARQAAMEAVERAFAAALVPAQGPQTVAKKASSPPSPRRTPQEVASLSAKFHTAVCASPGETMRELSQRVGATPHELQVPVMRLKREGQVRTAGQRQFTRYFPRVGKEQAA